MEPTYLKVALRDKAEPLLEGELHERIKAEDSMWSIEDNEKLILQLEKANETIWKTVLKGDKEIDTTKVDNSKPMQDFDQDTQVSSKFYLLLQPWVLRLFVFGF